MKDFLEARQEDYPTKDFFDVGFLNFKKVTKRLPLSANSFYPRDKKETNIRRFFFPSISLFSAKSIPTKHQSCCCQAASCGGRIR